jgi:hypothetical protein
MNFRSLLTFSVLALALLAPATASADKKPPVKKDPKTFITLTDGVANGVTVSPTVGVTFPPRPGSTLAKSCKGKIEFKAQIGTQKVKVHGKSAIVPTFVRKKAPVAPDAFGGCAASAALALPVTLVGKQVAFTIIFSGNGVFKSKTKTKRFGIGDATPKSSPPADNSNPPVTPPTIHAGTYFVTLTNGDPFPQWQFEIKSDGAVDAISQSGGYTATCASGYDNATNNNLALATPFSFVGDTATPSFHFVSGGVGGNTIDVTTNLSLTIDASGSSGTGTFSASGNYITHLTGDPAYTTAACAFTGALTLSRISG